MSIPDRYNLAGGGDAEHGDQEGFREPFFDREPTAPGDPNIVKVPNLSAVEFNTRLVALATDRIKHHNLAPGEDLSGTTQRERVKLLVDHALERYQEHTNIKQLPDSNALFESYWVVAKQLQSAGQDDPNYETLMQITDDIASAITPIAITSHMRKRFPYDKEPELADLVLRKYYLDIIDEMQEPDTQQKQFCLLHLILRDE